MSAGCSGSVISRSCFGSCRLNSIADDARFRARFSRTDSLDSGKKKRNITLTTQQSKTFGVKFLQKGWHTKTLTM